LEHINDNLITSLSEFKARPLDLIKQAQQKPLTVLNHNKPAFVVLTPTVFDAILKALDEADIVIGLLTENRV
jgi:antitoxin StbD